jgi:RecA/RadA recombinase
MTVEQIKNELIQFYEYNDLADLVGMSKSALEKITNTNCSINHRNLLESFFQKHCEVFSEEVTIPDINNQDGKYLVATPDGFQPILQFVTKRNKPCIRIETNNGKTLECASDHLIQLDLDENSDASWVCAGDICIGQTLQTDSGIDTIKDITSLEDQDVYDFEVDHPNHRYWSGGFSNHNTGKSLFIQKILANAQKEGLIPVIFDTENAIDAEGATRLGLDITNVKYVPCISIEQTRNALFKFLTSVKEKKLEGKFIVAIDSLGNLQSELELSRMGKDSTSSDMGTKARAMKSLMQTCTNLGAVTQTTIVCTNHVYDDPTALFPSIEKNMPGGKSCTYLPSVTVQLARKPVKEDGGKTNDGKLAVGQKSYAGIIIRALTRKNRFIKQYLEGEMYLAFSSGLDRYFGMLDLAVGLGVVNQGGATYTLEDGTKIGYYKNFRKDIKLWEDIILPKVEERIKKEWTYSNDEQEDIPLEADAFEEDQ